MKPVISAIIIALCWAAALLANIIRVPQDQPDTQAGINAAAKGDTVLVAQKSGFLLNHKYPQRAANIFNQSLIPILHVLTKFSRIHP